MPKAVTKVPAARHAAMGAPATTAGRKARPRSRATVALAHELHVHQIELETQNEELRRAQVDLAAARDRFVDLYDFAPVGYFTLDPEGLMLESNLTGAALLGQDRQGLRHQRFARFVAAQDGDLWHQHLRQVLQRESPPCIELMVWPTGAPPFHGQIDCVRTESPHAGCVRLTLTNVTPRKLAEMDRRIATSTVDARESERRRVARELHEELGQRLSALKMDLASLQPQADPPGHASPLARRLGDMLGALDDAVATVRRMAAELRPSMLDDLGLNAALDWLVHDTQRRTGLHITLTLDESDPAPDERTLIATYRMVQEMLAHIARQGRANRVHIDLHRRGDDLVLSLQDNATVAAGQARRRGDAAVADAETALGEQAHLLGGRLDVESVPDGGRRITVNMPMTRRRRES